MSLDDAPCLRRVRIVVLPFSLVLDFLIPLSFRMVDRSPETLCSLALPDLCVPSKGSYRALVVPPT